jgi:hypothetical protein
MACGTPSAPRAGSVPEVVDDGITGFAVRNSTRRMGTPNEQA